MVCKFCKTENVDDATYCKNCGKRVDGKKVCPVCKRLVADDATYCNYCGSRTDGKKVCRTCNEAYEGNFCPKCGETAPKNVVAAPAKRVRVAAAETGEITVEKSGKWQGIVGKVGHGLLLFGVIMALIFVFLIGYGITVNANGADASESVNSIAEAYGLTAKVNVYHYFGKVYQNVQDLVDSMGLDTFEIDYISPVIYTAAVMGTLIAAGTLVSVVVLSVMAIVKLIRKLMGKEAEHAERFAIAAILVYMLGTALLYAINYASVYSATSSSSSISVQRIVVKTYTAFNGATVAGIVLSAIGLGLGAGCFVAKRGAELANVKKLTSAIITLVTVAFVVVVASYGSHAIHTMQESSSGNKMQITIPVVSWMQMWAMRVQSDATLTLSTYAELIILSVLQIALVIMAIVAVIKLVVGIVENNETPVLGLNIALFVASAVYMVLAIVARLEPLDYLAPSSSSNDNYKITFVPAIIVMVFSLLGMAASITNRILNKKNNDPIITDEGIVTDEAVPAVAE